MKRMLILTLLLLSLVLFAGDNTKHDYKMEITLKDATYEQVGLFLARVKTINVTDSNGNTLKFDVKCNQK